MTPAQASGGCQPPDGSASAQASGGCQPPDGSATSRLGPPADPIPPAKGSGGLHPPLASSARQQLSDICDCLLGDVPFTPQQREAFLTECERVVESAKLESLAEFAAGAGHEINNPVATIAGRAQLLLSGESDPERRHALEIIGGQALRIRDMIGDVMLFARPPVPRNGQVALSAAVQQAVDSQAELFAQRAARVAIEVPPEMTWCGDRTQILVLLSSLIRNSLEAADRPGVMITVRAAFRLESGHEWSVLTVSDDGPGIPDPIREHIFDPFYSGRQAGRGLGFGLSKCWRIVQMHGGRIDIVPSMENGATFEIWWPPS